MADSTEETSTSKAPPRSTWTEESSQASPRSTCTKKHRHGPSCEGFEFGFSFAAAGWLQMYHFGVSQAIVDCGLRRPSVLFSGSSAGSLASACIIGKCDIIELKDFARKCAIDARSSLFGGLQLRKYARQGIRLGVTQCVNSGRSIEETAKELTRQLEVWVSVLPWCRAKTIREFEGAEDLEEALIASCTITPLAGFPFPLKKTGEWVCDGGMTAFQPRKRQPGVITVCPIYFTSADIKPSTFVPAWWGLYPPDDKQYDALFDLGYNDAIEFFIRKKLVAPSCVHLMKKEPLKPPRGVVATFIRDSLTVVFFLCLFRPFTILLMYTEMATVTAFFLARALSLFIFSPSEGEHREAWADFYNSFRNIISFRVLAHVYLGSFIPINEQRLQKFSRLYRMVKPFL